MPTGYTAGVGDGTVTSFKVFAMQCARAFGALILMRDHPWDAPIDESQFVPSSFYLDSMERAQAELKRLEALSTDEAAAAANADYQQQVSAREESVAKAEAKRQRYESMLAAVNQWQPPTAEHEGLKSFMREQIATSLQHDCGLEWWKAPEAVAWDVWLEQRLTKARENVKHYAAEYAAEVERCRSRSTWVHGLIDSLKPVAAKA